MSMKQTTSEHQRINEQNDKRESWHEWGPYLSERQWGTYARITARVASHGIISRMIMPEAVPTDGARTASPVFATVNNACAWDWLYGMERMPF